MANPGWLVSHDPGLEDGIPLGYELSRPFGTRVFPVTIPALKRRAIFGVSLRDRKASAI